MYARLDYAKHASLFLDLGTPWIDQKPYIVLVSTIKSVAPSPYAR
jgi:hypothetical protein